MAYATINKPNTYFNTLLYSGNNTAQRQLTGVGFQPDLVWIKGRSGTYGAYNHFWFDSVRGVGKQIHSDLTNVESTNLNNLYSFDSDGFSLGQSAVDAVTNGSSTEFASWNWLAGGTAVSNTDGTITSSVSANTTAGFSIVAWTGNGSASATVGHGLGVVPSMIICKERTGTDYWHVYHKSLGTSENLFLNTTGAALNVATGTNDGGFACPQTSSSTFSFVQGLSNVDAINQSGVTNIAYCFAEKKGFSKFGSYTGNGSADGTFVYTGFKPAFFLIKGTNNTESWILWDNKRRNGTSTVAQFNPQDGRLLPNATNIEVAANIDFLSNGFKLRDSGAAWNGSGINYIYMAFAENPLVTTSGVPATAR